MKRENPGNQSNQNPQEIRGRESRETGQHQTGQHQTGQPRQNEAQHQNQAQRQNEQPGRKGEEFEQHRKAS